MVFLQCFEEYELGSDTGIVVGIAVGIVGGTDADTVAAAGYGGASGDIVEMLLLADQGQAVMTVYYRLWWAYTVHCSRGSQVGILWAPDADAGTAQEKVPGHIVPHRTVLALAGYELFAECWSLD